MCGIAGIYQYADSQHGVDQQSLITICAHMRSRGPDDEGMWVSEDHCVALAHRRLAIIDPSPGGHQPMRCRFGDHVITFNGEIYNYKALKKALKGQGHRFTTESDTEVLLRLYQHYGHAMVDHLRGMYAFAIWDPHQRGLFIARDPYGIKPLYYAVVDGEIRFASQVKALFCGGRISAETNAAAEAGFLLTGSVMEPHTYYRDVHCLPAGHSMWIDQTGNAEPKLFSDVTSIFFSEPESSIVPPNSAETSANAFADSIQHHLVADVPVGSFLSAGIDSGSVSSLAADALGSPLETITLGFEEFRGSTQDETFFAAEIAASIGADHHPRNVTRGEFDQDFDDILAAMDQPTIDGINTWFASKAAAEQGLKVVLSGVGGDELLGGYPSFRDIPVWRERYGFLSKLPFASAFADYLSHNAGFLPLSPKAFAMLRYAGSWGGAYLLRRGLFMPAELPGIMGRDRARYALDQLAIPNCFEPAGNGDNSYSFVAAMESRWYLRNQLLRDTDWASMAHSVEVRTPLVDLALTKILAPMVAREPGKHWLVDAVSQPLPDALLNRAKTGFITPIGEWLMQNRKLDHWRQYSHLCRSHVHWSRRYAVCLHEIFFR
ncbi:MAG: asparagine synthase (glutamine-hydrolyzing) [Arenicellales bacterium]